MQELAYMAESYLVCALSLCMHHCLINLYRNKSSSQKWGSDFSVINA